jgi:uncharacterized membrane protein
VRARLHLIALLAALASSTAAVAADLRAAVTGTFAIAGKAVPLPAGEWHIVAERGTLASESSANVALRSAALVRLSGDRIVAAITVHTNETPLTRSLPLPADCKRDDVHLALTVYETSSDGACVWINHLVGSAPASAIDQTWRDGAAALEAEQPPLWLEAGFWIGDRQDVLDIRYHFIPPGVDETRPTGWSDSAWSPVNIGEDGPRHVAIEDLAVWVGGMAPLIDLGLHNRLELYRPVAMPWTASVADERPAKALRLRQLDALFATGAIDAAVYAAQHGAIEQEPAAAALTRPNIFVRAGYKTLTYKVLGTLDAFLVAWLVIGNPYTSLTMITFSSVAYSAVYYLHDVAWSVFDARGEKAANWTVLPIGIDRQH